MYIVYIAHTCVHIHINIYMRVRIFHCLFIEHLKHNTNAINLLLQWHKGRPDAAIHFHCVYDLCVRVCCMCWFGQTIAELK